MLTAALFIIAKNYKQCKCLSTQWTKCGIVSVEYNIITKRMTTNICNNMHKSQKQSREKETR